MNINYFLEDIPKVFLDQISLENQIGIDCEMTGLIPRRDKLCLIQIATPNNDVYIIKSTNWHAATNLCSLFSNSKITKIFHFAIIDCSFIVENFGIYITNAYCTKIASKLARTYSSDHSLYANVKELLQIELDKSNQSTFWCRENLTEEQITYAAHDVIHLISIKNKLEEILLRKGALKTGDTFMDINFKVQAMIPVLVGLWVNGWDIGAEYKELVFGK